MSGVNFRSRYPSISEDLPRKALFQSGDFSKTKKSFTNSGRTSLKDDINSIKLSQSTNKLNCHSRILKISNKENIDLNAPVLRRVRKNSSSSISRMTSSETRVFNLSPVTPGVQDVEDDVFMDQCSSPITKGTPSTPTSRYLLSTPSRRPLGQLSEDDVFMDHSSSPNTQGTPSTASSRYLLSTPTRKPLGRLGSFSTPSKKSLGKLSSFSTPNRKALGQLGSVSTPNRKSLGQLSNFSTPNRKSLGQRSSCSSGTSPCPFSYSEEYSSSPYISRSICICTPGKRRLEAEGLCTEKVVLGHGAYGTVALGRWKGAKVAVKVMKEKGLKSNRRRKSLEGELQACKMNHDNVLKVYNICAAEDMYAIVVMEYVGSKNLNRLLMNPDKHLPAGWLLQCGFQVASALQHCHARGVVHMDVKPANILITSSGLCKLGDFGCSICFDGPKLELDNALVGTPGYQAPEFLRGGLPSPPCDIYSLGIMLWQLDSREIPFQGVHAQTVMFKVVSAGARPSPPPKHRALVGREDFTSLYRKCWAQDPAQRPPSSRVAEQLAKMAQDSNIRPSSIVKLEEPAPIVEKLAKTVKLEEPAPTVEKLAKTVKLEEPAPTVEKLAKIVKLEEPAPTVEKLAKTDKLEEPAPTLTVEEVARTVIKTVKLEEPAPTVAVEKLARTVKLEELAAPVSVRELARTVTKTVDEKDGPSEPICMNSLKPVKTMTSTPKRNLRRLLF